MMSALFAQRSLDRHYLKDINVRLYVSTCNPDKEDLTPDQLNQFKSLKNQNQDFKSFLKASRPLPNLPLDVPVSVEFLLILISLYCRCYLMFL